MTLPWMQGPWTSGGGPLPKCPRGHNRKWQGLWNRAIVLPYKFRSWGIFFGSGGEKEAMISKNKKTGRFM